MRGLHSIPTAMALLLLINTAFADPNLYKQTEREIDRGNRRVTDRDTYQLDQIARDRLFPGLPVRTLVQEDIDRARQIARAANQPVALFLRGNIAAVNTSQAGSAEADLPPVVMRRVVRGIYAFDPDAQRWAVRRLFFFDLRALLYLPPFDANAPLE